MYLTRTGGPASTCRATIRRASSSLRRADRVLAPTPLERSSSWLNLNGPFWSKLRMSPVQGRASSSTAFWKARQCGSTFLPIRLHCTVSCFP